MLTNEMRRHAVIVALKVDHGDLEIEHFLRIAKSFIHMKKKKMIMSVSKRKKTFHTFQFNENTQINS